MTGEGFVHLHNHTEFSLLDGASKLKSMVTHVVEMGHPALAITDHGTGTGWYKFAAECRAQGIKPIIGIEAYLTVGGRDRMETKNDFEVVESNDDDGDFDPSQTDSQRTKSKTKKKYYEHITLLVQNETGWRNLVHMVNETARSFRFKPRMDYDLLAKHSEGIICLTGCLAGPVLGYTARALLEPQRIERKYEAARGKDGDFALLMREYRSLVKKGLVEDGQFPDDKVSRQHAPSFIDDWKSLAKDGFLPENPSLSATLNDDIDALCEDAEERMHEQAEDNLRRLIDIFGEENTFVEVMEHGIGFESDALPYVARLAERNGVRLVATNDAHYTEAGDCDHHDKLLSIQREGFSFNGSGYHLRDEDEMRELRDEDWWQEAVSNSVVVADMCEDVLPEKDGGLPPFPIEYEEHHGDIVVSDYADDPQGHADLLRDIIMAGMSKKGMEIDDIIGGSGDTVRERLNHEFRVVRDKGFIDYFLMVWDLLLWSRANGIYVGMGRGSVAGSLMAYLCEISWVDPLRYGLIFERFLEENRPDYPDMDLDFEQRHRHLVLSYLIRKYGKDYVARIGTVAIAASKRTVKDVVRVYGGSPTLANQLTKLIPMDGAKPRSLNKLVHQEEGAAFLEKWKELGDDEAADALSTALAIEGLTVGESIHACGTLISNRPLTDLIPLRKDTKKSNHDKDVTDVTQWEAGDIEAYGLLKLDILGLRNLDIVSEAIKNIEERRGEKIDIYYGLPDPNDTKNPKVRKAYDILRAGRTAGIFQLESSGMTELILRVSPDSFNDISALIALYRPGPMGADMHNKYADRKNGREEIDYSIYSEDQVEQEWIAKVLGETYGTFVYQEQLMNLGTLFAGFDAVWRNKLRKATAKKLPAMLEEVGTAWFENYDKEFRDDDGNIISPKFSRKTAETMWTMMQMSANYLFNKAHSAAYGMLTYITAYLKANYTAEYCAAILAITDLGKPEKRRAAFDALRDEGIDILPPSVNNSKANTFPYDDHTVIIGLSEIKRVGSAGELVAKTRHFSRLSKPFTSLHDLASRVMDDDGKPALSTSDLAGLIEAGACDEIIDGHRLGAMVVSRVAKDSDIPVPPMEWGVVERSARQRGRLGVSLGENPLTLVQDQLREWRTPDRRYGGGTPAQPMSTIPREPDMYFTTIGILGGYSERSIASGKMANLTIEGTTTALDGVMFNRALSTLAFEPEVGQIVAVSGYTRINDFVPASHDDEDMPDDLDEGSEEATAIEAEARLELSVNSMWLVDLDDEGTGDLETAPMSWSEAVEEYESTLPEEDDDTDPDDDPDGGLDDDDAPEPEGEAPDEEDDDDVPMVFFDAPAEPKLVAAKVTDAPEQFYPDYSDDFDAPEPDFDDLDLADLYGDDPAPKRLRSEPVEDEADDTVTFEDDDGDWLDDVKVRPNDDAPVIPAASAPSARSSAPDKDERPAPVIPIMQKQVSDGRKVPILYYDGWGNTASAYESIDPDVVSRAKKQEPALKKRVISEGDDYTTQVELFFERDYENDGLTLRYVKVVVTTDSTLDLTAIPPLYDTNNGTTEPTGIDSLFPEGEAPRKRGSK